MSQGLNFPSWQVPELPERIIRMSFCKHVFDLGKRTRRFVAECSYCHGHRLKRHGREHGHRRWVCRGCGKTFPDRTETVLSSSNPKPSQIRTLRSMLYDGTPLRQAARLPADRAAMEEKNTENPGKRRKQGPFRGCVG